MSYEVVLKKSDLKILIYIYIYKYIKNVTKTKYFLR